MQPPCGAETFSPQVHFRPVFIGESPGKQIPGANPSTTCSWASAGRTATSHTCRAPSQEGAGRTDERVCRILSLVHNELLPERTFLRRAGAAITWTTRRRDEGSPLPKFNSEGDVPGADRDDAAEPAGRRRGHRLGGLAARRAAHRGPPAADSGHLRSPPRRARPRVHARRLGRGRRPARSGSGAAKHAAGPRRRPPRRERGRRPARSAPVAQRAGHRAAHDLAGAARRRRPVPPQLPSRCGRWIRGSAASRPPHDLPDAVHRFTPEEARGHTQRLLDRFRELARRRGGRIHQQLAACARSTRTRETSRSTASNRRRTTAPSSRTEPRSIPGSSTRRASRSSAGATSMTPTGRTRSP